MGIFCKVWERKQTPIASLAVLGILAHFVFASGKFGISLDSNIPLLVVLILGGFPLLFDLLRKVLSFEFGADLLAGLSIVTALLLEEYLAGALVVLMLSGGEAVEAYAVRRASSVLDALAKRMPTKAYRKSESGPVEITLEEIQIGDELEVFPHDICPVDGSVVSGHGEMDESYLTGEPYQVSKTPGSQVISGSINGSSLLVIKASKLANDSRYAQIMQVVKESEQRKPKMRRLADQLGAVYTPLAVIVAVIAWVVSGEKIRFLAVLVVATPCPLLIAIPVAIIGAISVSARLGIIVRDPAILEKIDTCKTIIFDKTGTLTYGRPSLTEQLTAPGIDKKELLTLVASLEKYSRHPLASAILDAAEEQGIDPVYVDSISELPGEGLRGVINGRTVQVTSRSKYLKNHPQLSDVMPEQSEGLECVILVDNQYAATYRFRDELRQDGLPFINHLKPQHGFTKVMLVSGDREIEVRHLAEQVGIKDVYFSQSPEQKLKIVEHETLNENTIFIGDGINDAPALLAATVGIAMGQSSDITSGSSDAVILDSSLKKVDEFFHLSSRMKRIALQSAIGGMGLSVLGMIVAAMGYLPPVAGALAQEVIDLVVVLNALRVSFAPATLSDIESELT